MIADTRRLESTLFAIVVALGFGWIHLAGKDVNWDLINYHYYGAAQLIEGRLGQDFLAASIQSYINPVAYLPFYFLFKSGLGSLSIAFALGAVHLCNLYVLWLMLRKAIPGSTAEDVALRWLALLLALTTPVFLTVLGNTFIDPFSSLLTLTGLWVLYKDAPRANACFWGGLLFGAAVGIKLTNLVFVPAFLLILLAQIKTSRAKGITLGLVGLAFGWLLFHGYWSYLLWDRFRNPVFPFANHIFHSEDFPPVSFHDKRFQLGGAIDLLLLPWRMIEARTGIYTENISPDTRPLLFFIGLIGSIAVAIFKKQTFTRSQLALLGFTVTAYGSWLVLSTIGRYALAIWLLCGALLPLVYSQVFGKKWAIRITAAALAIQVAHGLISAGNFRWQPNPWKGPWLGAEIPAILQEKPALYLSIGIQTYASVIPFFHPRSSFINIIGQYPLPYGEETLPKMRSLIEKWDGNTYVLGAYRTTEEVLPDRIIQDLSALISVYGFRMKSNACQRIKLSGASLTDWAPMEERISGNFVLWACQLERSPLSEQELTALRKASSVFETMEKACPGKFSPLPAQTIRGRSGWQRQYFDQQSSLLIKDDVLIFRPHHSFRDYIIGRVDEILSQGVNSVFCSTQASPL